MLDSPGGAASVPSSLYDSLMSVLDRLGPARCLAQRLSVLGPSFEEADLDLVTAGADPAEVRAHLAVIVEAGVLRVDDGNYRFHQRADRRCRL